MKYQIKMDKEIYNIEEEENKIVIDGISSLYEFLMKLDKCENPELIDKE